MSPKFRARLKEFVETLLHPDKLPVKRINGQVITCEKLTAYLKVQALKAAREADVLCLRNGTKSSTARPCRSQFQSLT